MSINIELSSIFGRYTDNHLVIPVKGSTVGECLHDLVSQYPDLKKIFLDKNGNLQRSYQVFINGKSAYPKEMTKPVKDGDKVNITLLIQGG
jgi:molybdopterin converting factor small subunit